MYWDMDLLFLATKKAYQILDKHSGNILQQVLLYNQPVPQMFLSKSKCLILNEGNCGFFMDKDSGQKQAITFKFDSFPSATSDKGQIVSLLMHEIYVIVVFETSIAVFNA
mmetsp:Transcript_16010/g.24830  ORF Transcript_16010/g.24830 Transcript_16010/m.24830 type:complete len:110 (-) Transcript_16010:2224-2553(-)